MLSDKSMAGKIQVTGLGRDYHDGNRLLTVLGDVNLSIEPAEFISITGPSGSGKSTLLGLLAGLDRPSRGSVRIDATELGTLDEAQMSVFRGKNIGFVFQNFQLIPTLTALENVRVPAELRGDFKRGARAEALLSRVGLAQRMHHFPAQLSGGEMQRVAIARAVITEPAVIFADEPTGNLDSAAGQAVLDLLLEARATATLVLVTHNEELARLADREVMLEDGHVRRIVNHSGMGRQSA
jgi:putative ABC transport system ATP-binding protein